MDLIIKINLDNAAFEEDQEAELEKIFEDIYEKLETVKTYFQQAFVIRDSNGNNVGTVAVTE